MPAPKVSSVDAFFAKLDDVKRPHLEALRELSLAEAKKAGLVEALKWNFPAYTPATSPGMVWMLQCFKKHCSLRFPVRFFADHRGEVEAADHEAIEGALKIPWDRDVPKALVVRLLRARIRDFEAGNTAWSDPKKPTATSPKRAASPSKR
jgi:uncharacterized protein YdhG (YjbR/CyaY superfamily)